MIFFLGFSEVKQCISIITCMGRRAFSLEGSFNKINNVIFYYIMRLSSVKSRKIIEKSEKLVTLKSLSLGLSKISPKSLTDQNRFLPDLSYTFSWYLITCFLTAVRHKVNNLES